MTRPPAASIFAAAAITSITMKGGTSLRSDGDINRLAFSSIPPLLHGRAGGIPPTAPLLPHSPASLRQGAKLPGELRQGWFHGIQRVPEHLLTALFPIPSVRAHDPEWEPLCDKTMRYLDKLAREI
jgi:hypothetical protein